MTLEEQLAFNNKKNQIKMKDFIFYASFIIFLFTFLACVFALHAGEFMLGASWGVPSLIALFLTFKTYREDV